MARQNVRLVTFAWGRQYVDDLLDFSLSAVLAPGNLPALAAAFDCTVVIVTEQKLFDYVRSHPSTKKLERICPVKLIPLDDLVSDPWQYGMTLTHVLFRGLADLGPAMTQTYILFLNADFVLADGCYSRLIHRIRSGEPVHLAPSYCAVGEYLKPRLRRIKSQNGGVLAVPPRDLAAMIMHHPHNTIRTKTVNQSIFEFEYSDQFYWKVDADTLIGHQMPIALIGMRPERELTDPSTFWDWGIVYDFCPSKRLSVIGDSDDFLMLELRAKNSLLDSMWFGRSSPKKIASRLKGHMTQYQYDNAQFDLVLHSRELPSGLADARRQLRAYVSDVLRHLPSMWGGLRKNPQWEYHRWFFRQRLERKWIRAQMAELDADIERAKVELARERDLIDQYLSSDERKLALGYLKAEHDHTLGKLHEELGRLHNRLHVVTRPPVRMRRFGEGASYPYRVSRQRLRKLIRQVAGDRTLRILVVCPNRSLLLESMNDVPGICTHFSAESIMEGALQALPQGNPRFDLCVVEASDLEAPRAKKVLDAVAERISEPKTILVYCHDHAVVPLRSVHSQIVQFALDRSCQASASYAGSWASVRAAGALRRARGAPRRRRLMLLACFAPLAVVANLHERLRGAPVTAIPKYCSSATFRIDIPAQETTVALEAPIVPMPEQASLAKAGRQAGEAKSAAPPSAGAAANTDLPGKRGLA